MEPEFFFVILGDLADEALEGELADEQIGRLLILADLTESDGTGPVAVWLLNTTGTRSILTGHFGGEQFAGSFPTRGFARGLLGSGHLSRALKSDVIVPRIFIKWSYLLNVPEWQLKK